MSTMTGQGLYSLATIIKRLEAATSRIEDVANHYTPHLAASSERKEIEGTSSSSPPPPPPPPPPVDPTPEIIEVPKSVITFDETVMNGKLKPFVETTKSLTGESVINIVGLVEKQFIGLRDFIHLTAYCQKPDQTIMQELLTQLQEGIEATTRAKEASRKDREWFTHISFVGEAAASVGWVVHEKPATYLSEIKDSVMYYGNKVMHEFKAKDARHVEWVKAFMAVLEDLRKYVLEFHSTGLTWNQKGMTVDAYRARGVAAPVAPPPPPPPPPAVAASGGGVAAVFAQLNQGEEITKGLRKVDKSEMTHKNPALRASGPVPNSPSGPTAPKKPIRPSKPQALAGRKPAKFALEGNKWAIEYQENEKHLALKTTELNQAINIYGCKNSTIIIRGKVNAVTIVNCQSTSVLVESVVSSISVTRAPSFVLQITGTAPIIQLDSTDSGQIYLSKDSLGIEITTAKCSSINVSLPVQGEEDGVFEEQAIPEMLKTVVKDGKLVTAVVEHVG